MEHRVGRALLHITAEADSGFEKDQERWLKEEFIPAKLALPGFISARQFAVLMAATNRGNGRGSPNLTPVERTQIVIFELADTGASQSEAARSNGKKVGPQGKRLASHQRGYQRIYQQAYPSEGALVPKDKKALPGRQPIGPVLLHVLASAEPGWEAEIDRWYDAIHLPEKMTLPGYISTRRFELAAGSVEEGPMGEVFGRGQIELLGRHTIERPKHLALYDLESQGALAHHAPPNPQGTNVGPHLAWFRMICQEVYRAESAPVAR